MYMVWIGHILLGGWVELHRQLPAVKKLVTEVDGDEDRLGVECQCGFNWARYVGWVGGVTLTALCQECSVVRPLTDQVPCSRSYC